MKALSFRQSNESTPNKSALNSFRAFFLTNLINITNPYYFISLAILLILSITPILSGCGMNEYLVHRDNKNNSRPEIGMTETKALELYGKPADGSRLRSNGSVYDAWIYKGDGGYTQFVLYFKDGVLAAVQE